ncbi:hypothetical protein N9064_00010 [bacterium]|nr:hypothetical protein [bacterium]
MDQNLTSLIWTIVAIAAIFYVLNMFSGDKEGYQNEEQTGEITQIQDIKQQKQQQAIAQQQQAVVQQQQAVAQQQQTMGQEQPMAQQADAMTISMGKDDLTSAELLPNENGFSSWGDAAPETNALEGRNFLESGHHFGINTVGQSLRNANVQLRSDPSIPQVDVGPWLQSTIDQDTNKRQFEVGGDY